MNKAFVNSFLSISIRGRVAFGICCLTTAIDIFNYSRKEWEIVINQLCQFTDTDLLEEWFYKTVEYTPEAILQHIPFLKKEMEYIDLNTHNKLYNIYIYPLMMIFCK